MKIFLIKTIKDLIHFSNLIGVPIYLRSYNYIGNCFVINKELLVKLNNFLISEKNFHYDLILHCAENTNKFTHIPIP